jgi:Component of IIS longevity pathway SMK-1
MMTVSSAYWECLNVRLRRPFVTSFHELAIDDPEFPVHKANYRDFLRDTTRFHQPIAIHDPIIQKKIHHTYRLLFLKDVVLARALDDSTFNVLNSCIIFNQIDIITHVQNDVQFLQDVVNLFPGPSHGSSISLNGVTNGRTGIDVDGPEGLPNGIDEDRRRCEVILLIQQLCIMGKNVQLPTRMGLFKTLVDRGIVGPVQWALGQPEATESGQQMISVAGEVLVTLLDHDVNGVREYVVTQCEGFESRESRDESLLTLLCGLMVRSRDLGVQTVVGDSLKLMLEMPPQDVNEVVRAFYGVLYEFIHSLFGSKPQQNHFRVQGMTPERRNSSIISTNFACIHSSNPSLTSRITNTTHLVRRCPHQFNIRDSIVFDRRSRFEPYLSTGKDEPLSIFMRLVIHFRFATYFPKPFFHAHF